MAAKKKKVDAEPPPPEPEPVKRMKRLSRKRGAPASNPEDTAEEEGPSAKISTPPIQDTDDANSISSQDDDVQAKCSRRAIVNLQRIIDNVTEEINHEKEMEQEGVEDKQDVDKEDKENDAPKEAEEDAAMTKADEKDDGEDKEEEEMEEEEVEEKDGQMGDGEDTAEEEVVSAAGKTDTTDIEEDFESGQDKMESVVDTEESVAEEEEEKEDSSVTDAEGCAPPKLHKELAFLNQDMPVLDTAPDLVGSSGGVQEDKGVKGREGLNLGRLQGGR